MSDLASVSLKPEFSEAGRAQLAEISLGIFRAAGALERTVPTSQTREGIADILSGMNSYYSNLIEGVKTWPAEVEAALRSEFSGQPKDRDRQRLALAHIETEREMRGRLEAEPELNVHDAGFIGWLHANFYGHLPESLRVTETHSGQLLPVEPGEYRDRGVVVGRHRPPDPGEVPVILEEFANYFSGEDWLATDRLIVAAASHHRLSWVHPFLDGNGRVARLYSHACLIRTGVDGNGLWSLSRGLARNRQGYYDALAAADEREPFAERERLSETGLLEFTLFFLEALRNQVDFMNELLELSAISKRMESYVRYEIAPKKHGEALARLLKALFVEGEMVRGDVKRVTGLRDTAAREVIHLAFSHRLIQSPSPKGKIALAFPSEVLEAYFPRLYLDLPV